MARHDAAFGLALFFAAAYLADQPGLVAAAQLPPTSLLDLSSTESDAPPHQRFVRILEKARASFTEVDEQLSAAEAQASSSDLIPPDGTVAATRTSTATALVPVALRSLSDGIETLKRVRSDVAQTASSLSPEVRTQVLWDIDRMTADAERLRTASLAPLARNALLKALSLRFGVLLTPAFWTTPVKRSLLTEGIGGIRTEGGDAAPTVALASSRAAADAVPPG